MLIGITGGIACGKSTIGSLLKSMGYKVIDADVLSHELIKKPHVAYYEIIHHFGEDVLLPDKEIDRQKLSQIIFNDIEKKQLLEEIIHPKVIKEIKKYNKEVIAFFEVPLLFEAKMEKCFRKIIVVETSKELQMQRLMARDKITEDVAIKKINSQMPIEKKIALSDYVIHNTGDIEYITKQLECIINCIRSENK